MQTLSTFRDLDAVSREFFTVIGKDSTIVLCQQKQRTMTLDAMNRINNT